MIGNKKNNFPHNLLLTDRQVLFFWKTFANNSLVKIKLLKTQLSKMIHPDVFVGKLLGPLLFAIDEKCTKTISYSISQEFVDTIRSNSNISSRCTNSYKNLRMWNFGPGTITLIISNKEMKNIMKIVKSLEESGLLIQGFNQRSKNKNILLCY